MSGFIETHVDLLIMLSLGIAVVAFVVAVVLFREVLRLRRPFKAMAALHEGEGADQALEALLKGVDENRGFIQGHSDELKRMYAMLDGCYCGMGLVKYNAFEDVGGNQSYSLCMLTRERNGFILTSLVGRNATRSYALDVVDGKPSRELGEEEQESLAFAQKSLES